MAKPEAASGEEASDPDADPPDRALWQTPRTLALVAAVTVLVLGLPATLLAIRGRWDVLALLVVVFAGMVYVTARLLRGAVEATRGTDDGEDD